MAVRFTYSENRPDCQKLGDGECPDACLKRVWKDSETGKILKGCFLEMISQSSAAFLDAYYYYDDKNMWPNPGCFIEQPVKLLKAFNVISAERAKIKREEDKRK